MVFDPEGRSVPSLEVRIDGSLVDPLPKLPVDPGAHVVELRAHGYVTVTRRLELHAGDRIHEDLVMRRQTPTGSTARGSAHDDGDTATENAGGSKRTLAYVLGGAGVLAIGVGAVSGVIALNAKSDRDDACRGDYPACTDPSRGDYLKDRDGRIATAGNIATVAFVGGALLVVASTWLFLTSRPRPARAALQPWQGALTTGTLLW
ncbi:MAG: hypothetical protein KIT84_11350 [Labilithrix sp.]|nr:hypothetical protein [Labilithrix sp.]MCW5811605.1 hypothetical protein [Labilithrix sp.]